MTFGIDAGDAEFAPLGQPLPSTPPAPGAIADLDLIERVMGMNGAFDGLDIFASANGPEFLSYEIAAGNLVSSAHDLARVYAATVSDVDGIRLLRPDTIRDARLPVSAGAPFVGVDAGHRWGTGFMLNSTTRQMAGEGSFGHDGAGGQLGFARLEGGVALGYQTLRPGGESDTRAEELCRALRHCL